MSETDNNIKWQQYFYSDFSLWALILSNVVVMVFALIKGWSLFPLMLVYCCHSVSIGFFWFFKLLALKDFSTQDCKVDDMPIEPTPETKVKTALFFLAHFGCFHLMYFLFLVIAFKADFNRQILYMGAVFFVYQFFSLPVLGP